MRDIVSTHGTLRGGLTALPTIAASQYSPALSLKATIAQFNGLMVYILVGTVTGSGSMTPTLQVTDDSNGSPVANNWTSIPTTDLVAWQATSASDYTPVKRGQAQPAAILAASNFNQRVGWLGSGPSFTANSSPGDGAVHDIGWFRVASVVSGSWSAPYDVIIALGLPDLAPSIV